MPAIEPFYLEFGRLLSSARAKAGLSQERLGERLDPPMTRASIANMETGKQRVLAKTLVDLAEALEIEVSELIPKGATQQSTRPSKLRDELGAVLDLPPDQIKELARQLERSPTRR